VLKSDKWIRKMAVEKNMISPFSEKQVSKGMISYGLSSYGYDIRLAEDYMVPRPKNYDIIDPKKIHGDDWEARKGKEILIEPNSHILGRSVEYFRIPRNVIGICVGKSTYARCGIIVNVTPLEPEWEGFLTISISNTSRFPATIHAGEGIAQIIFFESDEECEVSYKDKDGRYQGQLRITLPKVQK